MPPMHSPGNIFGTKKIGRTFGGKSAARNRVTKLHVYVDLEIRLGETPWTTVQILHFIGISLIIQMDAKMDTNLSYKLVKGGD